MRKIIFLILYIICNNLNVLSQQLNTGRPLGNVMPQTFNFMRYGDVSTSLSTGAFNLDIPIYTYVDNDFKIPISLSYTTSGFTPTKRSGIVGYDWTLNIGGVITRDVYGKPDDLYNPNGSQNSNETDVNGFWWASNEKVYTKNELWNFEKAILSGLSSNVGALVLPLLSGKNGKGRGYDGEQDIFYFNFMGHSGKFAIGNDRKIICSNNGYKVIPNFAQQHPAQREPKTSSITIISPDGYRYIFGRDVDYYLSAIEYSKANLKKENQDDPNYNSTTLAWHLTEIIAPNGRKVLFKYRDGEEGVHSPMFYGTKTGLIDGSNYDDYWETLTINKIVVLEAVEIPDTNTKITFAYSQERKEDGANQFYKTSGEYNALPYKLDNIDVKKNNLPVHTTNLSYIYHKCWRFLSKVINQKTEIYNLEYNLKETPINANPEMLYYNGGLDPIEINGYLKSGSNRGLLNKVTYPTGGWTEFTYHSHSYSEKLDFNMTRFRNDPNIKKGYILKGIDASELPPVSYNGTTGGQRIYKITSYSKEGGLKEEREFLYLKNYNPKFINQKSSGILYNERPYWMSGTTKVVSGYNILWGQFSSLNKVHVAYSEVTEVRSNADNKLYTKHLFTDYGDAKFKTNGSAKFKFQDPDNEVYRSSMTTGSIFLIMYNNLFNLTEKVGYLKEKRYLNSDFETIKFEEFKYRDIVDIDFIDPTAPEPEYNMNEKRIVSHRGYAGGAFVRDFYIRSYPKFVERIVLDGVEDKIKYEYNKYDQLKKESKTLSNTGETLTSLYRYMIETPTDVITYFTIRDNNFVSLVDEKEISKNKKIIGEEKLKYSISYGVTKKIFPVLSSYEKRVGSYPYETIVKYDEYDKQGNLLQYTQQDGTPICHLWSYNGQYPIAEIKNATYAEVVTALQKQSKTVDGLSAMITPSWDPTKFRTDLSNALITTYTYQPLVGMLTATDPSGKVTSYEYDSFNRLYRVKDHEGKIVEEYMYNYVNK